MILQHYLGRLSIIINNNDISIDWVGIVNIIAAVIVGVAAIYIAKLQYNNSKSSQHIEMYSVIERLEERMAEYEDFENNPVYQRHYVDAIEHLLNRIEIICHEYLNNRLDKKSFEHMYFDIVYEKVKDPNLVDYYYPSDGESFFNDTLEVYNLALIELKRKKTN